MVYTLGEAAKATGKSKPTIQRAIKSGTISAIKKDDGSYSIEPSELHRVFPPLPHASNDSGTMKQSETQPETGMLQRENELLRERLEDKDHTIADLRRRLDAETEERRKLTAILTDQRQPQSGFFWSRLFKRQ
jgi:excisionase family DNA binding protein